MRPPLHTDLVTFTEEILIRKLHFLSKENQLASTPSVAYRYHMKTSENR